MSDCYFCDRCGWVYDPELGDEDYNIRPGDDFESLPNSFKCPECGAPKDEFIIMDDEYDDEYESDGEFEEDDYEEEDEEEDND